MIFYVIFICVFGCYVYLINPYLFPIYIIDRFYSISFVLYQSHAMVTLWGGTDVR
ncbi:hypothetical protein NT01EI_3296 [Edwardsiella ictaluri 93-146]|uniref:Uncharacterized protein n=1 Tax=Edwardsiella ictaluri (strain 93-146) TaxID=634503 RepID=C5B907_EDWI9|nr:hypothetical protein NT01EI_3296 [Edwardsiella ictaluri 93-146]